MPAFRGFLSKSKSRYNQSDPVNLLFFNRGSPENVARHLDAILKDSWFPPGQWQTVGSWFSLLPTTMLYACFFNHYTSQEMWPEPSLELGLGDAYGGNRFHIRIFAGPDESEAPSIGTSPGQWSIAAIHREHWIPPAMHIIHGWNEPQTFLHDAFSRYAEAASPFTVQGNAAGWYQGYWFDGQISCVELLT